MTWFASWKRAGCALLVLAGSVVLACSPEPEAEPTDRICAPGTNVVCKCKNLQTGTKLCNDEGTGYATECSVNGSELCPGGEETSSSSSGGQPSSSSGGLGSNPDACPGQLVAVPPNAPIEVSNSTLGASDDAKGSNACAAGAGAPDHVYRIVPAGRGSLKLEITSKSAGYAPLAYLRRGDCDTGAQVGCAAAGGGKATQLTQNVVENEPYWLIVDGAAGPEGAGQYQITATLTPGAFCGDAVADPGEVCDDGNNVDGDGCSADCKNFNGNPASAIQCPGQPVHLWLDGDVASGRGSTASATLVGAKNTFDSVPSNCSTFGGPGTQVDGNDHVYELIAHGAGKLLVSIANPSFYAKATTWTTCDSSDPEANLDQCESTVSGSPQSFDLPIVNLTDGQHYTLVIDGNLGESGDYEVQMIYTGN